MIKRESDNDDHEYQLDREQNRNAANEQHVEDTGHDQHGQRSEYDRAEAANDLTRDADPRRRIEFRGQHRRECEGAEQRAAERDDNSDNMNEQYDEAKAQHQVRLVSDGVASEQATPWPRRKLHAS